LPTSFASETTIVVAAVADSVGEPCRGSMSVTPTGFGVPASFASETTIVIAAAADSVGEPRRGHRKGAEATR